MAQEMDKGAPRVTRSWSEMMIEARNGYDELFVQDRCFHGRLGTTTFHVRRPVASVIRDVRITQSKRTVRVQITRSILQHRVTSTAYNSSH